MSALRIALTPGEPAGIGPDITLQLAHHKFSEEIVVFADKSLLQQRAKQLGLSVTLKDFDPEIFQPSEKNVLSIHHIPLKKLSMCGVLEKENAAYVLETLHSAATACLKKKFSALVTGPVHKQIINESGISFLGHTEFLANLSNTPQVVMLFVSDYFRVALATTHIPLAEVSHHITQDLLENTLRILNQSLKQVFNISHPRIAICGLNPHAGEGGYLGREEIDTIQPIIKKLQSENYALQGPFPADTIFLPQQLKNFDAILAMYHDQGLPVLKYAAFDKAVNMTLGLPFIRTSVDHGTALDLAGTEKADAGSLLAAVKLAIQLTPHPNPPPGVPGGGNN
ncbi:MAG: 4-hydroxythreonine-4-phosphate dehydrogenase PdxA [Proteobacteria bacterium]|nr:4-hydroxythreonine-4-phosphate dehydrogenase PdxA [Pseudomonadota bacterium]